MWTLDVKNFGNKFRFYEALYLSAVHIKNHGNFLFLILFCDLLHLNLCRKFIKKKQINVLEECKNYPNTVRNFYIQVSSIFSRDWLKFIINGPRKTTSHFGRFLFIKILKCFRHSIFLVSIMISIIFCLRYDSFIYPNFISSKSQKDQNIFIKKHQTCSTGLPRKKNFFSVFR